MKVPLLTAVLLLPVPAAAATVREARIAIAMSPKACEVTSRFAVDTATPGILYHTLMLDRGGRPPVFSIVGAVAGRPEIIGRVARLPISLIGAGRNEYTVRYQVGSPAARDTCPLLVPVAATDGLDRAVTIAVAAPAGAQRLPGDFPAFQWSGTHGRLTLGHVPSFVRVPHAVAGTELTWRDTIDPRRVIDVAAIVTLACASLVWAMVRRARA